MTKELNKFYYLCEQMQKEVEVYNVSIVKRPY